MNANGFCVKKGQGLKNYHSNFPPIALSAPSPGTHIFPKGTPSTAPNGVLIETGFWIGFSGSGKSLMKLGIRRPGPPPGEASFQEERLEYSSQRCLTRGSPIGFLGSGMSLMKLGIRNFLAKRGRDSGLKVYTRGGAVEPLHTGHLGDRRKWPTVRPK